MLALISLSRFPIFPTVKNMMLSPLVKTSGSRRRPLRSIPVGRRRSLRNSSTEDSAGSVVLSKKFLFQHGAQDVEDGQVPFLNSRRAFSRNTNTNIAQWFQCTAHWPRQSNGVHPQGVRDLHRMDHIASIARGANPDECITFMPVRIYLLGVHHISSRVVGNGGEQ